MKKQKPIEPLNVEHLVLQLYDARQAASVAKTVLRAAAVRLGNCTAVNVHGDRVACYHDRRFPKDQWCDICKEKLPLWEDYHRKANAAGAALRAVLQYAKKKGNQ